MATVNANVFAAHTPIYLGLLRNGPASDVVRTSRESSLAAKYYFRGTRYFAALRGDAATRRPNCPIPVLLEAEVRCAFSTLVEADVDNARSAHVAAAVAGGPAFDADAARATAAAKPGLRLEAIALGSVHTSLVISFEVTQVDLRESEVGQRKLRVTAPAAAPDQLAYFAYLQDPTHGWTIVLDSNHAAAAATPEELVMLNMAALTADEVELAYAFVSMGQAAPVRAGAQLFTDAHHYHSDANSSTRHRAIELEVIGRLGSAASNIWRANIMMFRNAIWHAGIHFVREGLLQDWAEDLDMPERLDATGYGSMSVGLPAQEDLFNRAGSYTAVYNQVVQTATAHGHAISVVKMTKTVQALGLLPRRGALPAQRPELPDQPAAPWPNGCDTRAKALKLFLEPALDRAEPVAAWMFGFYREICSRSGIRASSPEGSLLRSYSLKRAVANFLGEANRAQEMYSARARYIRTQAEEGNLENYQGSA